jgi:proprotein convertase subtilisin/kexin type 5
MNSRYLSSGTCVTTCSNPLGLYDVVHMTCVSGCLSYLLQVSQNCVYCANGTYFYGGACGSNCSVSGGASAYYPDDSYHACMTCSTYCNTCDGPYPENCTSCVSSSGTPYLLLKMCWAICPKGFYPNPTSGKCEVCPVQLSCQSCKYNSGTSAAYCTSCIYGSFYYSGNSTCISTCNTNQYQNTWNNSCTNCDPSCVTCNGPSSYSCLSCPGVNNLLTNSTGGYCLATCPSTGYVQVGTTCQPCDSTCITCNGVSSNQCATCQSGYYLYNGYCRYICPSGTYPDSTSRQCLSCDSSCSYCFNGTAQSCTSCSGSLLLYNFTCGSTCPVGMTANQWNVCFELLSRFSFIAALCLMAML